jgi:hypothetical protein
MAEASLQTWLVRWRTPLLKGNNLTDIHTTQEMIICGDADANQLEKNQDMMVSQMQRKQVGSTTAEHCESKSCRDNCRNFFWGLEIVYCVIS